MYGVAQWGVAAGRHRGAGGRAARVHGAGHLHGAREHQGRAQDRVRARTQAGHPASHSGVALAYVQRTPLRSTHVCM